jgi:hypothetical protein
MAIPRPDRLSSPQQHGVQPMVRKCPSCAGDLEVITARREQENPHNYWCIVCGRIFEINYLGREDDLDQAWSQSVNP